MRLAVRREAVCVPGFRFAGVAAGLKEGRRKDVALIFGEGPLAAAGVFTTNRMAAAPVRIARKRVRRGWIRAVLVNTHSANAATGEEGLRRALASCRIAAERLGVEEREIVPCSTGKIGLPLDLRKLARGIDLAARALSPWGLWDAAEAIRTTDAFPKVAWRTVRVGARTITVAGLGKGAGMIHPRLATTLAFVLTDAAIPPARLRAILRAAVASTFNAISVDGDTSTNDTVLLLASGASGSRLEAGSSAERRVAAAAAEVLGELARMIVADGEGAAKVVRIVVRGARHRRDAERAARAVANSLLVKTAFAGADPNWGRIACAVGYSGAFFEPARLAIAIGGVTVARRGEPAGSRAERAARRAMHGARFDVEIDLGVGRERAEMLASDLGVAYVRFNSRYSS
jgi:glutamate N-acetyltransferase/amino-acid N-acetyltransferase